MTVHPASRAFLLALALSAASVGVACAQETVGRTVDHGAPPPTPVAADPSTTPPANAKPATAPVQTGPASSDPTRDQINAWLKSDADPVQPLDPRDQIMDEPGPRQMHGEVTATISNRGYGGSAAVSMPLGQASELDLAVAAAHVRTRWGNANPKSLAIGLHLDGGDVGRWLSHDKCNVPRYGVNLPDDPIVRADGSCFKTDAPREAAR